MSDNLENSRYFYRIITLVVDIGTDVLLQTFYSKIPKVQVKTVFAGKKGLFNSLKSRAHVLTQPQYDLVTSTDPKPEDYDISLLNVLLRNVCPNVDEPANAKGWNVGTPDAADATLGAELLRFKAIRNKVTAHTAKAQIDKPSFLALWREIKDILIRIARMISVEYEDSVEKWITDLKDQALDPMGEEHKRILDAFIALQGPQTEKLNEELQTIQKSLQNLHIRGETHTADVVDAVRQTTSTVETVQRQVSDLSESLGSLPSQDSLTRLSTGIQETGDAQGQLIKQVASLMACIQTLNKSLAEMKEERNRHAIQAPPSWTPANQQPWQGQGHCMLPSQPESAQFGYHGDNKPAYTNPHAISERDLEAISKKIGHDWSQLMTYLDFEHTQKQRLEAVYPQFTIRVSTFLTSWHGVVVQCGENPRELLAAAFLEMSNREMACFIVPRPNVDEITKSLRNYRAKDETIQKIHAIDFMPSYGFSQLHPSYMGMQQFSGQQFHYQPSMQNMATPGGFSQPGQHQPTLSNNMTVPGQAVSNQQHQTPSTCHAPPNDNYLPPRPETNYGATTSNQDTPHGLHHSQSDSVVHYGAPNAINVFPGAELTLDGSLSIGSLNSMQSSYSQPSSIQGASSMNVVDGARHVNYGGPNSLNVMGGKVNTKPGSNITLGAQGPVVKPFGNTDCEIRTSVVQPHGRSSELKKPFNDCLSQSAHNDLNTQMQSVGALISDNNIGTVFVVGQKYAMTAWHVVRDIIQDRFGIFDTSKLDQAFINFNENPNQPAIKRFYVEREPTFVDENLDVAVLEIKGPFNLPPSVLLCKYDLDLTGVTDISLCGFGQPESPKKHIEHGCQIIMPNSTVVTAAIAHLQTRQVNTGMIMSDYYRRAIQEIGKDSSLVDLGYSGYDNASKLLFNCFMEHGASGSPILTPKLRQGTVYAVGVLTKGIPDLYFDLPKIIKTSFPAAYRFEMGAKMSHVYSSMLQTKPNLAQELFGS